MNRKLILIIGMLLLMVIPFTSAGTLNDPDSWDYTYTYHAPDESSKYGYYEIEDTFLWIFNKKEIKTVKLIENDYSVLSAWNIKEIEVFQPTKLFDRTDYFAKDKETDRSSAIKSEQQLYRQLINKTRYINVWGNCTQYNTITNGTNSTTYCIEYEDLGYEEDYQEWTDWEEYKWGSVQPGIYQTKTIVSRVNQYTGAVDWIDTNEGRSLKEWAVWWDANWAKKREISSLDGTNTEIAALYNISYYSGQTDFDDLRFLDKATESTELNFTIISKVDGSHAMVRVANSGNDEVMMYYDNPGATSTSSFDGLYFSPIAGYTFDNGNANDDSVNGNNGEVNGPILSSNGKIGSAYDFSAGIDNINLSSTSLVGGTSQFTLSMWINADDLSAQRVLYSGFSSGISILLRINSGNLQFYTVTGSQVGGNTQAFSTTGSWVHIMATYDGTTMRTYVNNVLSGTTYPQTGTITTGQTERIGYYNSGTPFPFDGRIDEVYVFDYELTTNQRNALYKQTAPSFVVGSEQTNVGTTIQQIYPNNGLITDEQFLNYTYNITTEGLNFTNTTLTIWNDTEDTVYLTNFTALSGNTSQIINYTNTLPDGDWKWNAEVCTSDDACTTGSNRTYTIDTTPFINITTPLAGQEITVNQVQVNVSLTEKYFDELILNLNYTNGTLANTTTITDSTRSFTFGGVEDGLYDIEAIVNTNTSQTNSTTSGEFIVHTTLPQINITAPSGVLGNIKIGENETLNYSVSELGKNISHFSECWFEYNNTEVLNNISYDAGSYFEWEFNSGYANVTKLTLDTGITVNEITDIPEGCIRKGNFTASVRYQSSPFTINTFCTDETGTRISLGNIVRDGVVNNPNITAMQKRPLNCSENTTSFEYVSGKNQLCVHAVDIFGLHSQNDTAWIYNFTEISTSFNNITIEGSTETFSLNFTKSPLKQVSRVNLVYDGEASESQFITSGNNVIASLNHIIPNIDADGNKTFFFNILFSDGTEINSSNNTQLVQSLSVDNCSSFSNLIFNYTHRDEETQDLLTENDVEIAINLWDSMRNEVVLDFSTTYNDTNPIQVCININFTSDTLYSLDSVVKYTSNESTGYALEYYNFLNFSLQNSTIPQNINLYSLLSEDTTEFQLTFRDSNLALASDILVSVDRQYVSDNDFKTVEKPITDTNGQAVLHLVRNDIQYNFIMTDIEGNILATFNKKNVFCEDFTIGSCTLNLNALATEEEIFDIIEDVGISYATSYNNSTKILSLEFISLDLLPKTVGLVATRDTDFGNRSVCNKELTSSSGIIECNVSDISSTDRFLFLEIFVDGDQKATETEDLEQDNSGLGENGLFLAFFILLAIITIFVEDKKTLVVAIGLGWVGVISLGLVKGTLFGSLSAGIWLVVTITIFLWKLGKEESA